MIKLSVKNVLSIKYFDTVKIREIKLASVGNLFSSWKEKQKYLKKNENLDFIKSSLSSNKTVGKLPRIPAVNCEQEAKEQLKKEGRACLLVHRDFSGQRIDNYLIRFLKGVPKSCIYRLIRSGKIKVNEKKVEVTYRLQLSDRLYLSRIRFSQYQSYAKQVSILVPKLQRNIQSEIPPFPILYEDEYLLAVDKPAGTAVHGGSGINFGVIEKLRQFLATKEMKSNYLELVHRLDKETSGVLLLAKKRSALLELHKQMRERVVEKKYFACTVGDCFGKKDKLNIQMPLRKYFSSSGERRVLVDWKHGQFSETVVFFKKKVGDFVLVEVLLKTGRTHQIRVHLSSLGFPIVGDDKYGNFELNKWLAQEPHLRKIKRNGDTATSSSMVINRMFLHAHLLRFHHPISNHTITITSPLPQECQNFLEGK